MSEERHTNRGKWSQPDVPHKGWACVGSEDLEEPSQLCEMCESVEIRYAHFMQHPDYPESLTVGCVCAEHMEGDYVNPRQREKRLKGLARRRQSWSKRQWRLSGKGNPYLNTEGFNLTVFQVADQKGSYWSVKVSRRSTGASQMGHRRYDCMEDAKKAALDALVWAKDHLRSL